MPSFHLNEYKEETKSPKIEIKSAELKNSDDVSWNTESKHSRSSNISSKEKILEEK